MRSLVSTTSVDLPDDCSRSWPTVSKQKCEMTDRIRLQEWCQGIASHTYLDMRVFLTNEAQKLLIAIQDKIQLVCRLLMRCGLPCRYIYHNIKEKSNCRLRNKWPELKATHKRSLEAKHMKTYQLAWSQQQTPSPQGGARAHMS